MMFDAISDAWNDEFCFDEICDSSTRVDPSSLITESGTFDWAARDENESEVDWGGRIRVDARREWLIGLERKGNSELLSETLLQDDNIGVKL